MTALSSQSTDPPGRFHSSQMPSRPFSANSFSATDQPTPEPLPLLRLLLPRERQLSGLLITLGG